MVSDLIAWGLCAAAVAVLVFGKVRQNRKREEYRKELLRRFSAEEDE